MMMQMLGAFAEFERAMLREPNKAGLESASRQGRIGAALRSLSHSSRLKSLRWFREGEKRLLMPRAFSKCTRRRFHAF
jgi:DNA invertase Pin-like site-specific DNA recombinase